MRTSFHPFLPNGPTGDPLVWIDRIDDGRAMIFDLGDLRRISSRKILRLDHGFISHTHLDHFFGFDRMLRVCLTRESEWTLHGPPGFIGNVCGRLSGYNWNLIESYPIRLRVAELAGDRIRSCVLSGAGRFHPEPQPDLPFSGVVFESDAYRVDATVLDHGTPVLGFAVREREHLAINRDRLEQLGLQPGDWLNSLKAMLRAGHAGDRRLCVPSADGSRRTMAVGELSTAIVSRSAGQSMAYLSDLRATDENFERAIRLVERAQLLICEAAFLDEDADLARQRNHLTARQAGELARRAGVRRLAPVHFSRRYRGREQQLLDEAAQAFGGPIVELPQGPDAGFSELQDPGDPVL